MGQTGLDHRDLPAGVLAALRRGGVIPAHPLALTAGRTLDPVRQRALSRYYIDAGASGLAVGVHTTQFAIREAGLLEPVLKLAAETAASWTERPLILIAGLVGRTAQALREADLARGLGYHAGLLSLAALRGASEDELIAHCQAVARRIPVVGFYLQPAVGGIVLSAAFWRRFAAIDNVVAIKIAPFNRYRTLDVVRGVVEAGAEERITLLTGNDDHIVLDLLTPFRFRRGDRRVCLHIEGGLLGHWCVWTRNAVEIVARIKAARREGVYDPALLALDAAVTDANGALFDAANEFPGLHRRLPRGAAPPGPARGHLVPRPGGGPEPRSGGRDRPRLCGLSGARRRRLRRRPPRPLAGVTRASERARPAGRHGQGGFRHQPGPDRARRRRAGREPAHAALRGAQHRALHRPRPGAGRARRGHPAARRRLVPARHARRRLAAWGRARPVRAGWPMPALAGCCWRSCLTLGYAAGLVGRLPFWLATWLFVAAFVALFEWPLATTGAGRLRRLAIALIYGALVSAAVSLVFQRIFLVRLP